jgi:hypothetical protein
MALRGNTEKLTSRGFRQGADWPLDTDSLGSFLSQLPPDRGICAFGWLQVLSGRGGNTLQIRASRYTANVRFWGVSSKIPSIL